MTREFTDLPGWRFTIHEVSAGCYRVEGQDAQGHQVSTTGTDVEAALNQCKLYAIDVADSPKGRLPK
jgi:hypothetical protein